MKLFIITLFFLCLSAVAQAQGSGYNTEDPNVIEGTKVASNQTAAGNKTHETGVTPTNCHNCNHDRNQFSKAGQGSAPPPANPATGTSGSEDGSN